jgi:hypothetical protein
VSFVFFSAVLAGAFPAGFLPATGAIEWSFLRIEFHSLFILFYLWSVAIFITPTKEDVNLTDYQSIYLPS